MLENKIVMLLNDLESKGLTSSKYIYLKLKVKGEKYIHTRTQNSFHEHICNIKDFFMEEFINSLLNLKVIPNILYWTSTESLTLELFWFTKYKLNTVPILEQLIN